MGAHILFWSEGARPPVEEIGRNLFDLVRYVNAEEREEERMGAEGERISEDKSGGPALVGTRITGNPRPACSKHPNKEGACHGLMS